MPERVLLAWSRRHELDENDEHLNDGYISVEREGRIVHKEDFSGMPYHQMVTRFSSKARPRAHAQLFTVRLDQRPAPIAMEMDPQMSKLLRDDPVAYIRATSMPRQQLTLSTRVKAESSVGIRVQPLRAGFDSLADAFGDHVYVRVRLPGGGAFEAECPECGRWVGFGMKAEDGKFLIRCDKGCHNLKAHGTWVPVEKLVPTSKDENPRWAVVAVKDLLAHNKRRYYLPRAWNTSGPWIGHDVLVQKLEDFNKERNSTCSDRSKDTDTSV